MTKPRQKTYLKLIAVVLFLLLLSAAVFFCLAFCNKASSSVLKFLLTKHLNSTLRLEIGDIKGTLATGLRIDSIKLDSITPKYTAVLSDVKLSFPLSSILSKNTPAFNVEMTNLDLRYYDFSLKTSGLPDYHPLSCLLPTLLDYKFEQLRIKKASIHLLPDISIDLFEAILAASTTEISDNQPLSLEYETFFRSKSAGKGLFYGSYSQKSKELNGKTEFEIVKQKVAMELLARFRKNTYEISGFVSSATFELSPLSHWLCPLWQDDFPFGFDGKILFSGSWLYNPLVGFVTNLDGRFEKIKMIAMGLFLTIFEISGDWKLFDDKLTITDSGSSFVGAPALITGTIESITTPERKWSLAFDSVKIDMAELLNYLPWSLKYAFNLPEMRGDTCFNLKLSGNRPKVFCFLKTDKELLAGTNQQQRAISGNINYSLEEKGDGQWRLLFDVLSDSSLLPLYKRMKLNQHLLSHEPVGRYHLSYECNGKGITELELEGVLKIEDKALYNLKGRWKEGAGLIRSTSALTNFSHSIAVYNLQLLDFILAN